MALEVVASIPNSLDSVATLNAPILITFNSSIENTYITDITASSYFQVFERDTTTKLGILVGKVIGNDNTIYIKPIVNFKPNTNYVAIVISGENGVKNTDAEILYDNYVIYFKTNDQIDNTVSINIENNIVTISPTVEIINPPIINFEIPETTYQSPSSEIGTNNGAIGLDLFEDSLKVLFTSPENYTIGNNTNTIKIYFNKYIKDNFIDQIKLSKTNLPFEIDLTSDKSLNILSRTIADKTLTITYEDRDLRPGYPVAFPINFNSEYTLTIPEGAVVLANDSNTYNSKYIVKYSGPLSPLFTTPDNLRLYISDLDPELYTDYILYKRIHSASFELMYLLGFIPNANSPTLYWAYRYMNCYLAASLTNGPYSYKTFVSARKVLGQSVQYSVMKNSSNSSSNGTTNNDCILLALKHLGLVESTTAATTGVKSLYTNHYPGRIKTNIDKGYEYYTDPHLVNNYPVIPVTSTGGDQIWTI